MINALNIAWRYAGIGSGLGSGMLAKLVRRITGNTEPQQSGSMMSFLSRMSMIGLIIGVALLYTVLSVMNGFDYEMRTKIIGVVPQGVIYLDDLQDKDNWDRTASDILARPEVVSVTPFSTMEGLFVAGDKSAAAAIIGIQFEGAFSEPRLVQFLNRGETPKKSTSSERQDELVEIYLGAQVAKQLQLAAGDTVSFVSAGNDRTQSASVYNLRFIGTLSTQTEVDNALAIVALEDSASLRGMSNAARAVDGLRLQFDDIFEAAPAITKIVRDRDYTLRGDSWMRTHGNLYHAILMSKRIVSLLMALVIAIAAFNVVSTLVLVIMDKQGDIAILRTMGARKSQILSIFLFQGLFIGLIGAVFGLALGAVLASATPSIVQLLENVLNLQFLQSDVYPITYIPVDLRLTDALHIFVVVIGLTFLATIFPAWLATRIRPAQALRYE